ncbi:MAG: hypothetical protein IPK79_00785 [Vampirovibrionales bacterium]|nr:hypothetical protein [Vampirovibrionales bacterium]
MSNVVIGRNQGQAAYNKVWRMMGSPTLSLIYPMAEWTLPTGVSYDRHYDQFVDAAGTVVEVDWADQPTLSSPFLTQRHARDVKLQLPGQSTQHEMSVVLPWSSTTQDRVDGAWGVLVDGNLYRVASWECQPAGVETPVSIVVQLREENR